MCQNLQFWTDDVVDWEWIWPNGMAECLKQVESYDFRLIVEPGDRLQNQTGSQHGIINVVWLLGIQKRNAVQLKTRSKVFEHAVCSRDPDRSCSYWAEPANSLRLALMVSANGCTSNSRTALWSNTNERKKGHETVLHEPAGKKGKKKSRSAFFCIL